MAETTPPLVDVMMLRRPNTHPPLYVRRSIALQHGVRTRLRVMEGRPLPGDASRWETIVRGRNALKAVGDAPWVLFVDDDVALGPRCIIRLLQRLEREPKLGAVGSDYNQESRRPNWAGHVGMGACLFRREVLDKIEFRWQAKQCECRCAAEDLRGLGYEIAYEQSAPSKHLNKRHVRIGQASNPSHQRQDSGVVLAAFDRRDVHRFENQFVRSLHNWGNPDRIIAVGYGLYPSEVRRLESLPNVEVQWRPSGEHWVPVRRLNDFAGITQTLDPATPVAYWDVSDVIFQSRLNSLWSLVAETPDQILAVIEPKGFPENGVIKPWTWSIQDRLWRWRAYELLKHYPFLNSGFAAGTAASMNRYFRRAHAMRFGPELTGSVDWGDQMCLNLYCHMNPSRWRVIDERWNYCVHDRPRGEVVVTPDGVIRSRRLGKILAAHGNARSLRQFSLLIN
ncbi:MAG: glycosyltransferase family 2 protein [Planctomycetota bacterium]